MPLVRLAFGVAHVGAIVAVAAGCFLFPLPVGLLVVASNRGCHRPPEPCPC